MMGAPRWRSAGAPVTDDIVGAASVDVGSQRYASPTASAPFARRVFTGFDDPRWKDAFPMTIDVCVATSWCGSNARSRRSRQ